MASCRMAGTIGNAMRRDLGKRLDDLERVAGQGDDGGANIPITDELRTTICANPDDEAAFERLIAGDQSAIRDLSMDALRIISDAGNPT